jgi:glycosyltransferase involved in cell wall biosynthesis
MRIVVAHSRYRSAAPSGENAVVDQETALLRETGHEVIRFELDSDAIASWPWHRRAGVPVAAVWNAEVRRELATLLRTHCPDVLHVHNTFPLLSPSVLAAADDAGVPVVATLHNYKLLCASGDFFRDGEPCHSCAEGRLGPALAHGCYRASRAATLAVVAALAGNRGRWREQVAAYVFVSAAQRDLMAGLGLPPERVFVKHNGVPSPLFESARRHQVAYLGRLDAAKGVPQLLAAWDHHRTTHPDSRLRLVIAGDGPLAPRVATWAAARTSVRYAGRLTPPQTQELLTGSLAAVVPSAWEETFGLVAVEAMAAGTPPIAPAHGSFPELIRHGIDGLLVRPGSPSALAAAFAEVDRNPDDFVALGATARATYLARFTPGTSLDQLLAIYRFAIQHPTSITQTRTGALR